jgi:hypothetical protein
MVAAITRIQRRAAQIITRAFRTTAGAGAEVEAHLLPPPQQLEQTAFETTMRIRTTPVYEEMAPSENNNMAQSPLNRFSSILESKYNIQLDRLEKRQQHIVPPWWIPPFTCIDKSRMDRFDAKRSVRHQILALVTCMCRITRLCNT